MMNTATRAIFKTIHGAEHRQILVCLLAEQLGLDGSNYLRACEQLAAQGFTPEDVLGLLNDLAASA